MRRVRPMRCMIGQYCRIPAIRLVRMAQYNARSALNGTYVHLLRFD